MSLPSLKDACASQNALFSALSILLEPSSSLQKRLVPALSASLSRTPPGSYAGLCDSAEREVGSWSQEDKADFLGGHPRIGEVKNLSAHSSKEQDNSQTTPPKVLAKLEVRKGSKSHPSLPDAMYTDSECAIRISLPYLEIRNFRCGAESSSSCERYGASPDGGTYRKGHRRYRGFAHGHPPCGQ